MTGPVEIAAFYRFAPLPEPAAHRAALARIACAGGLRGTVLLAPEGVNGTVAGPAGAVAALLAALRALPGFAGMPARRSQAAEMPFRRMKVRLKREIVTLGQPGLAPAARTGTRVPPADWDALLDAPDVAVIDTRNAYEVAIGRFDGAIDPGTGSFRDFPAWWAANRARLAGRRIAMYCTGGIRCEKASAYLLGQGVAEVLQLDGGILGYLETVPAARSRWQGECFVFDGRVAVGHGLAEGSHGLCHACGRAVSPAGRAHEAFREGVSCPACIGEYTDADRARFAERERQARLAAARGGAHLAED
ncbi:rhodanese-related sulfurtransferase [Paralimibaculum aggregatum]|uniref:tRNA uridine(34) hydroxylase n=1 Tax=Paralimibaculum aggregatum TaxID=3036245 RepID=A0ABQ6LTR6_9RHOB|nr:rhodanese-related sulfurtransferase [Limibaculum sp. NKW23]GMG85479.1 rhodanese-related sulfurtransferase [Limibaculum sp. NKW23]